MVDYQKLWAEDRYRNDKDRTFLHCDMFLALYGYVMDNTNAIGIGVKNTVIDWGCGNGSHAIRLSDNGLDVIGLVDIAPNSLDKEVESIFGDVFHNSPIRDATIKPASFSYCVDVLEHMNEEDIDASILNIVRHTTKPGFVFLNVATQSDVWDGEELHETIQPHGWWMDKFVELVPGTCLFSGNLANKTLSTFWNVM